MNSGFDSERLSRLEASRRPELQLSFEFFPPKTDTMEERFWESLHRLAPLHPRFVSVTYGAGGSTRERTLRMVRQIRSEAGLEAAAHLTCVGASKGEVDDVVRGYKDAGITRIVALRGDPPEGTGKPFVPHPEGYRSAAELVEGIRKIGDFDISVAAYPEKHPQSPSWEADIDNLKRKLNAGAIAPSPRCSSTTGTICASSSVRGRPESPRRSCRAFSRSIASSRSPASPPGAGRRFRAGSPSVSPGLRTIRKPMPSSLRQ